MKLYIAADDEISHEKYHHGLRVEIFLSMEAAEKFIATQENFGDWLIGIAEFDVRLVEKQ